MQSGKLFNRIEIQSSTETQSSSGAPTKVWSHFAYAWANVEGVTGRELIRANQVKAEGVYLITTRYIEGVTVKMRVVFRGKNLDINSVSDPTGRRRELHLYCKEAAGNA